MTKNNTQIIVLSRNYSTGLGIIRALGEAGYRIDLIASVLQKGSSVICASSKYLNRSIEVLAKDTQRDKGEAIIKELMAYDVQSGEKIILFPADDYTTSIIDTNRYILSEKFILPYVDGEEKTEPGQIMKLMDKAYQAEAAAKSGLNVPIQQVYDLEEEVTIKEGMTYPAFVKPMSSVTGYKREMAICNSEEELKAHLKMMRESFPHRKAAVQEYLNIATEYDFSGLCLGDKVIIPGILQKTMVAQHMRGVTIAGIMKSIDEIPGMKETVEKVTEMLRSFRYYGMFDMELNQVGDKIYFGEVNLRSGGPNYAYCLSGVNLPDIFVKEVKGQGHKAEEEEIKIFGKSFVYEKVAWQDYINGYITKEQRKAVIDGADFKLLDTKSDPKPGEIFARRIRLSALKHTILNWRKK